MFFKKSTLNAAAGCRDNKCGQFFKIALSDSRTGPGLHESDSQSLFQIVQKYFSSGNLHQSLASVHPLCTQICVALFLFQRIDISTGHGQAGKAFTQPAWTSGWRRVPLYLMQNSTSYRFGLPCSVNSLFPCPVWCYQNTSSWGPFGLDTVFLHLLAFFAFFRNCFKIRNCTENLVVFKTFATSRSSIVVFFSFPRYGHLDFLWQAVAA